jgi:hypothetical protein
MRYQRKPLFVEAIQFTGRESCAEVFKFMGERHDDDSDVCHDEIDLPDGRVVTVGDWIILDPVGTLTVCSAEQFEKAYERVSEPPADQARRGRCGALNLDGEPTVCFRWRGHQGPHRGARMGHFYRGDRYDWKNEQRGSE